MYRGYDKNGDYINTFHQFVNQKIETNSKALFELISTLLQRAKYIFNNY